MPQQPCYLNLRSYMEADGGDSIDDIFSYVLNNLAFQPQYRFF